MKPSDDIQAGDDPGPIAGALSYMLIGPMVWALHLLLVYTPQAMLCAFRITGVAPIEPLLIRAAVGAVSVAAAAALLAVLVRPRSIARPFRVGRVLEGDNGRFIVAVMRLLSGLSLAGVVWAGAAALVLDACAQLR